MEEIRLYEESEFYEPFPEGIGTRIAEGHRNHLFPVGAYRYNDKEILIAIPLGDEDGSYIPMGGEFDRTGKSNGNLDLAEFNLTYCLKDGKWALNSDLNNWSIPKAKGNYWYETVLPPYLASRDFYAKYKYLAYPLKPDGLKLILFRKTDNLSSNCNWYNGRPESIRTSLDQNNKEATIYNKNGEPFISLGYIDAFNYIKPLSEQLHYLYEPKSETVLVIAEHT